MGNKIKKNSSAPKRVVLSTGDDLILQRAAQIAEGVGVPRHAHDQVAVLLGVLLRLAQRGRVHHVKLDVVAIEFEVGADELHQSFKPGLICQQVRGEFLVE